MNKICTKCKLSHPLSNFNKNKNFKDGLSYQCKDCYKSWCKDNELNINSRKKIYRIENSQNIKQYSHTYYHENKEEIKKASRKSILKKKYNISEENYNVLNTIQQSKCAICYQPCSSGRKLAVDHCHKTNKIRGLLCIKCNRGLGYFVDNIELLSNAISYLQNSQN